MNSSATGYKAESVAAEYLASRGFSIIERNFKTPRCEIDIIARKGNCTFFVEVKYRSSSQQGGGIEYVTSRKQRQMQRAAEIWLQTHSEWRGDVTLSAVEIGGDYKVIDIIESID